ncbi:hypothetical protein ACTQKJ_03955 [Eggerthellaceae bacterium PR-HUZ602407-17]
MMENFELLDKLTTANKEDNKDEFTRLCMNEATYEGAGEEDYVLSLYVVYSTIGEDEDTYIGYLQQYATDEENTAIDALFEKIERFEEYDEECCVDYDFEVPEAEKDEYKEYVENKKHYAANCLEELYWKYEDELDGALIWDNAEKIIEDLFTHLTEIEQYQFALKKLEDAKTREEFLLACDDSNEFYDYPLSYELYADELRVYGTDYSIHLQPGEVDTYIKDHYPDDDDPNEKAAADYLFAHAHDIIEEVKATIKELENDENNEEEFDVNARHDDWDFFEAV